MLPACGRDGVRGRRLVRRLGIRPLSIVAVVGQQWPDCHESFALAFQQPHSAVDGRHVAIDLPARVVLPDPGEDIASRDVVNVEHGRQRSMIHKGAPQCGSTAGVVHSIAMCKDVYTGPRFLWPGAPDGAGSPGCDRRTGWRAGSTAASHPISPTRSTGPRTTKPAFQAGFMRYRYGDSNPGFRRERAAS